MKIPKQIFKKLDEKVQAVITEKTLSSIRNIMNEENCSTDIKAKTHDVLWKVYKNKGYDLFIDVVNSMITIRNKNFDDFIQVKGEIAEVVLEILIYKFIKEKGIKDWYVYKSLILGDKLNPKFSTEIDLVLITRQVVSVIEAKSYNGNKTLLEKCFITTRNGNEVFERDVFSQNRLHIQVFWDNFKTAALNGSGAIKSVLFSFSKGDIEDNRTPENRKLMPVYTEKDFASYLNALIILDREPCWEVKKLVKLINKQQEKAISIDNHIDYVKSLHPAKK